MMKARANNLLTSVVIVFCIIIIYLETVILVKHVYNSQNNDRIDQMHNHTVMSYEDIRGKLKTGDIMMTRSNRFHSTSTAIMFNTIGDAWSHCGLIYVSRGIPYVITSRHLTETFTSLHNYIDYTKPPSADISNESGQIYQGGVSIHRLDDEMILYKRIGANLGYKTRIGFKVLNDRITLPDDVNLRIMTYLKQYPVTRYRTPAKYVVAKVFDVCYLSMLRGLHSTNRAETGVICSEITADILQHIGIIKHKIDTRWLEPSEFELRDDLYKYPVAYYTTVPVSY